MWTCFCASKKVEKECLVSLVADLRHASLPTVRFITETLLLLEVLKSEHAFLLLVRGKFDVNADDLKTDTYGIGISISHLA